MPSTEIQLCYQLTHSFSSEGERIKEEEKSFTSPLKNNLDSDSSKLLGFNPPTGYRMSSGEVLSVSSFIVS